MIACVQRVLNAKVEVDGKTISSIDRGLLVLLGVVKDDNVESAKLLAEKICNLRIFADKNHKMSLSVKDINGEVLVISQFTLAADLSKGNRPDFSMAELPTIAEDLYKTYVNNIRSVLGADRVGTGIFGADMQVSLVNDGPVTLIIER
ncbi:MAG: D-tyrosyl-tRNA(Tyr) deacylase [Deferribacteraceae bacterium]|jgi:D-tyrosyl-tRNA(Tyr) deacylase|nr:D-tyrosyl-tRNA(Tyr) deacylase [Deferribacteraceae bacterium]